MLSLKVLAIVVIVPVFILMIAVKLLVTSYILGPFMLFLIGCVIYTIIQSVWSQLLILVIMLMACVLALFGAS